MPANIPSPVVGAGGQGSRPWFEQLLLTLASQGPGLLMQFLEHRQAGAQADANNTAAQGALGAFATSANPAEAGAITGAGGSMGVRPTPAAASPSGIKMPSIRAAAQGNQPNMSGMQSGVAAPLLEQLRQLRQDKSALASTDATTAATVGGMNRANALQPGLMDAQRLDNEGAAQDIAQKRELFPLEKKRIASTTRASDASVAESKIRGRQVEQQMGYDTEVQQYRVRMAAAQALGSEAELKKATQDVSTRINDRAMTDMERIAKYATDIMQVDANIGSIQEARQLASLNITGIPNATAADLRNLYTQLANDPSANLDKILRDRTLLSLGLAEDEAASLDAILGNNAGDPQKAIEVMDKAGASVDQLSQMQGYFYATTGQMAQLPKQNSMLGQRLRNQARQRLKQERVNETMGFGPKTIEGRGPVKREPGKDQGAVSATIGVPQPIRP